MERIKTIITFINSGKTLEFDEITKEEIISLIKQDWPVKISNRTIK